MRPRRFYVAFAEGCVVGIFEGADAARAAIDGGRSYFGFRTRLAAEEFAAWWEYDHPPRFRGKGAQAKA